MTEHIEQSENGATSSPAVIPAQPAPDLLEKANDLVRKRVYWSIGVGFVPVPLVDFAALLGIQLEMVSRIATVYGQSFRRDVGKNLLVSLLGSVVPSLAAGPVAGLLKFIPIIGYTTSVMTFSIVGGASTYAIGQLFIKHFASGGTLFDFDPARMKEEFSEKFKEGKEYVADLKKGA